jgi:glucan 1,3-beta-glucosidase
LNETWTWGVDKINGVNLGGWLNTGESCCLHLKSRLTTSEPFIVPALYETYKGPNNETAIDEFTLSQYMGDNLTAAMTDHCRWHLSSQNSGADLISR